MEKYGVELDPTKEKTAGKERTCPKCGGPILEDPPKCDQCGTEGFEKKTEEDGNAGHGGA